MTKRKAKTILLVSDLHCGHRIGLTPPSHRSPAGTAHHKQQRDLYDWWVETVSQIKPYAVMCVGDLIDGAGKKSGGSEQVTTNMIEQAYMAVECLRQVGGNPKYFGVGGTEYHTGQDCDFEEIIAREMKFVHFDDNFCAAIKSIPGVIFDIRHHLGNSSVPYGKATAILKELVWNEVASVHEGVPEADIIIRGHTHHSIGITCPQQNGRTKSCIKLPAMEGHGSRYGKRRCSGEVHVGFALLHIYEDKTHDFEFVLAPISIEQEKVVLI